MIKAPYKGELITTEWARKITDAANHMRVRAGYGIIIQETPNGSMVHLAKEQIERRARDKFPFHIEWGYIDFENPPKTYDPENVDYSKTYFRLTNTYWRTGALTHEIGVQYLDVTNNDSIQGPNGSIPVFSGVVYMKVSATTNGIEALVPEIKTAISWLEYSNLEQSDLKHTLFPLYLFDKGEIKVDFRATPSTGIVEVFGALNSDIETSV